jgi:hypothetical protein
LMASLLDDMQGIHHVMAENRPGRLRITRI